MALVLTLANCSFPTTFEALGHTAAFCGNVLIITACVLVIIMGLIFWLKRLVKLFGYVLLTGVTLVGGISSFALANITSRNQLECAGVPNAGAELVRRAEESYHTLLFFQFLVGASCVLTFVLVLTSIFSLCSAFLAVRDRKVAR